MENKGLVSLVIPAFNHEEYISDIIRSILNQTYDNIEVLITDDCSSDKTYECLCLWREELENKFQRVQILRNQQNRGIAKTVNSMLRVCKGEYIKLIASDDFLMEDAIENLVRYLEKNPQCGLVFANGVQGNTDTHFPLKTLGQYDTYYSKKPEISDDVVSQMYCKYFLFSPSIMYTRKAYQIVGEYDETIWAEDWDYYLRVAEKMPICYLDAIVVMYRVSDMSASHSTKLEYRIGMRKSEISVLFKHKGSVSAETARSMLYDKCNEVFKEAFDMRSKEYMKEIYSLLSKCSVKLSMKNKLLSLLYSSHLVDFLFS